MKSILILVFTFFIALIQGCNSDELGKNEIIGTWVGPGKSKIIFTSNGRFSAEFMPAELVVSANYIGEHFSGNGDWYIRRGSTNWEVYLDFKSVSDKKYDCAFPLLIAGENGILGNKPPWYLFLWEGEEGGDQYKLSKFK